MLSALYIKGFKTFARPVRMPLEGGVTAIVGPNGSGKSNITDAVLFALGEQSAGLLRAGAMGDVIFSGSESLPATSVAEVSLVFDNSSGGISLPYEEVSLTRRISRDGGTEYRINGSRARLSDVRSVAGEAGLGRHSILRQGAVDAIVSGGAEACRQALEEAAGLGVYRRRRISASRRLEKAEAQLEQSRNIEVELSEQLKKIEREAVAAREYREIETRYRALSLASLYRQATGETETLKRKLEGEERESERLVGVERELRVEEETLESELHTLEGDLRSTERVLEGLDDGLGRLGREALGVERGAFRIEARRNAVEEQRRSLQRLQSEAKRVQEGLTSLRGRYRAAEEAYAASVEERDERSRVAREAREALNDAEREHSRVLAEIDGLRTRRDSLSTEGVVSTSGDSLRAVSGARDLLENESLVKSGRLERFEAAGRIDSLDSEASLRRGRLSSVVGRVESRIRSLRGSSSGEVPSLRLHEVVRAHPGYEFAVEAALGEFGAGLLAADVSEGVGLLSEAERVAVRLDAEGIEENGASPGEPLVDCVEVTDERYAGAVERLLGGIFVVEDAACGDLTNGYVAVTREGIRLTRTSVSLASSGGFARQARLSEAEDLLAGLESGPEGYLREITNHLSLASTRRESLTESRRRLTSLISRSHRCRDLFVRELKRLSSSMLRERERASRRESDLQELNSRIERLQETAKNAGSRLEDARRSASKAAEDAEEAAASTEGPSRERKRLREAISEGARRMDGLSTRIERARGAAEIDTDRLSTLTGRLGVACERVSRTGEERRARVRISRAERTEGYRNTASRQTGLARRLAEAGAELASARGRSESLREALLQTEQRASGARQEITEEWGASLEDARQEARSHGEDTEPERAGLARKLKRFGDVNLLALSQESEVRERHEIIASQRADAEEATVELNRIIQGIDEEIESRFTRTFERVRERFGEMVPRMLSGASGVLDLSEEGVEIGLRLGRKGWRSLKVLSGGERSLLALSFLFSILLVREGSEGPFCILDEAEAALDDVNLARFISVVDSHRAEGQFLLVTHQKRTMAAADVLYGVVQDASGATTVVSKRLQTDQGE